MFTNGGKGRTHVRVPDPSLLVGVRTGMHVEARGAWLSERPPPGGARRLRVEAESALCVLASGVKVTSTGSARFGVPRSAPVAGYDGEAAAMGAGQPAEVINPLVADQVSTLFIPSELSSFFVFCGLAFWSFVFLGQ